MPPCAQDRCCVVMRMSGKLLMMMAMMMGASGLLLMGARLLPSFLLSCPALQRSPPPQTIPVLTREVLRSRYRNLSTATGAQSQSKAMPGENEGVRNVVVYVTVPNKDAGRNLAKSIVHAKLAACVNQVPGIESTYWWQGKVETESEELLIIKTREPLLEALTEHVKSNHPYDVPEVIALPIVGGSPAYLKWLEDNTQAE